MSEPAEPATSSSGSTCGSAAVVVREVHDRDVVRRERDLGGGVVGDHDREQTGALLAGALRDQLLGPVGEADQPRALVDEHQLVAQRAGAGDRGAEPEPGVRLVVGGQQVRDRLGLVEQPADVGAGQAAGTRPNAVSAE